MVENHMIPAVGKATLCKVNADTIQYLYDMIRSKKYVRVRLRIYASDFVQRLRRHMRAHFLTDVPKLPFKKTKNAEFS